MTHSCPQCEFEGFTSEVVAFHAGCAQTMESPAEPDEVECSVNEVCTECGYVATDAEQTEMMEAEEQDALSRSGDDYSEYDTTEERDRDRDY